MRHRLSLLLLPLLFACASRAREPEATPGPAGTETVEPIRLERPLPYPVPYTTRFNQAINQATRTRTGEPGPAYWQQRADYDIDVVVSPEYRRLEATGTITYHNQSPDTLNYLYLNLLQNFHAFGGVRRETAEVTGGLELRRVVVDGRELAEGGGYGIDGTLMLVTPPRPVAPGTTAVLDLAWSFDLPQAGISGRMGHSGDDLLYLAYWFPQMAVYDDVIGWHADQFTGRAEFYSDFGRYDVTVEAPEQWVVVGTGTLQNREEVLAPRILERLRRAERSDDVVAVITADDFGSVTPSGDGALRWHLVADSVRDFAFGVTRRSLWDAARIDVGDRDGDGAIDYARADALYRPDAPRWREASRYVQHAIGFLSRFTGTPYPWSHMTAVEGAGIIGGGMEYPMMTLMGDYDTRGDSALYAVTAHELAHMWVPMIVSTNERRFSWLDEGTTTFNENNAKADFFPGLDTYTPDQQSYIRKALSGTEGEMMRWSDWHYQDAFGTASYAKPASVLHALRGVLGEPAFNMAYMTFFDRWAFRHPYPWDFWNTFEDMSGRDLDWFWRAWYYESTESGAPWVLEQAIESVVRTEDGATRIHVRDRGWIPMPVHLTVTREDGTTERVVVSQDIWLRGRTAALVTVAPGPPVLRVEIDANGHFPDVDRSNNVWRRR